MKPVTHTRRKRMRKPNKWIYSWKRQIKDKHGVWVTTNIYQSHSACKKIRKISNRLPYPVKWVECRKPNPEYQEI